MELTKLLAELASTTKTEIASKPEVVPGGDSLDVSKLAIKVRKWTQMNDIVVVFADMKNSTKLGTGSHGASTASIYEAGTGGVVRVFDTFNADFIQIQGDGAFAIFWGDKRYERAICARITIKTNSVDFADQIANKWPAKLETGYKVGVASGRVLVKRVGTPRNPAQQEPVWAGKPVNYAAKAALAADRHQLVVTGSVWDYVSKYDYLAFSCDCGTPSDSLWKDITIDRLPEGDDEALGRVLTSSWCTVHGEATCNAVLAGNRKRSTTNGIREAATKALMLDAIRWKAKDARERKRQLKGIA